MAAKDLMFKIAIFDDTKTDLGNIKKNLSELENYALGVSRGVTAAVRSIKEIDNGFKLNVPDLTSFAEQIGKIDKALGKKDAFKVKDLEDALNTIKKFGEQLGEVPIKRNALAETLNNMSSQVEIGAKKMGTATTASLETYRDQLKAASKDIETNIGIIRERINAAFNNGNLTPKGGADLRGLFGFNAAVSDRAVSEFVRGFEGTLTRVQEKLKSYDKSIVNNQYLVGDIGKIKEDLNQLETAVTAVRNGLSSKGILGNMPENTNKQMAQLGDIIGKLDALEQKLQSFGNGTYPDVMRGFITAVDNAVKQVSEKLRGLNDIKLNIGQGATESNKGAEQAVKSVTDAIREQEIEVNKLAEAHRRAQDVYTKAIQRNDAINKPSVWDVMGGTLTNKKEASSWVASWVKKNGSLLGDFYHLNDDKMKRLEAAFEKRYQTIGNARAALKGLINEGNGILAGSSYNTSFGQNNAQIKINSEALSAYRKEVKAAAKEEKDAEAAVDAAYKNLMASQARLNQLRQQNAKSTDMQAAASEKLAASQQKVQSTSKNGKELSLNFKEDDLVSPLEKVQQRIRSIIEQISKDVSGGLKDALNTDISATKTVQSLNELANGLSGLESVLAKSKETAAQINEATATLQGAKENMAALKGGGIVNTNSGAKTADNEEGVKAETYVRNINLITNAILQLSRAYTTAAEARTKIAAAKGDTTEVDKYLGNVDKMIQKLGELRTNVDVISQKGMMLISPDAAKDAAAALGTTQTEAKELLRAISELGNVTPKGEFYQKLMASASMFKLDAKELETAARLRETTLSNVGRRDILSKALVDITNGSDLRSALGRFNTITSAQEGMAFNQSSLKKSVEDIIAFKNKIDALSEAELNQKGKVANLQAEYNKLTSIYRKHLSQYNQLLAAYEKSNNTGVKLDTSSLTTAENKIASLTFAIKEYDKTIQSASQLNLQGDKATALSDIEVYVQRLRDALSLLIELRENALAGKGAKTDAGLDARSVLSKYNVGANEIWARNYNKELKKEIKASQGSVTDLQTEANRAFSAITNQITRMDKTMRDGLKFNVDTSKLEASMQVLRQYQQELEAVAKAGGNLNGKTAKMITSDPGYTAAVSQAKMEQTAVEANVSAKREAEQANKALANSENTVAQAIVNATGAARGQSQVLSDLKSMAAQYLSVWGAQQFISDMTHITGELELQERSLEVILGNASAAREMYSQIRDLSQISPYTFEDLLKSHRQLAAFGIEAKDIFGTLKSLSDIGAGLDVDVSRLILAYGHTKSYGYLSGIQNRQFETAGIDLVGSLTDLYNKRADENKKLGINADYVTRADIFKKMRDRSIPFSDVQEVIMDLDKPGGKFYNMQIKQYDTLGGKLRNLKNNYRIMMSEIGESNHGLLAGSVDMINELTANWSKYGRVLKGVAYGYAAMKLAALAAGRSVMAANRQIYRTAATTRASNVANAYLNNPTSSWWRPNMSAYTVPVSKDMSNAEFRNLKTSKEINNITKQRIALTGALNPKLREELLVQTGVNQARAAEIAGFPAWKRGLMSIRLGLIQAGQAAKAFTLSLLTNPMTWIFAAVGVFTSIKSKLDEASESARSFADNLKDAAKTDQEGIRQSLDEYGELAKAAEKYNTYRKELGKFNDYWGVGNKNVDDGREYLAEKYSSDISSFKAEAEARGIENTFEDLRKKLETQSPFYAGDYFDIMKANNELDQLANMFEKYRSIQYVKGVEERRSGDWESRMKSSASGGESFTTNMSDYAKTRQSFISSMEELNPDSYWSKLTKDEVEGINAYAQASGEAMRDAASKNRAAAGYFAQNSGADRIKKLFGDMSKVYANFSDLKVGGTSAHLENIFSSKSDDFKGSSKAIIDGFISDFQNDFRGRGADMSVYMTDMMNKWFSDAKVSDPGSMAQQTDDFVSDFINQLGNKVSNTDKINFVTQQAQGLLGKIIQDNLKINENMTDKQVQDAVKHAVNVAITEFKRQFPKLSKIMKLLGINLDNTLTDAANNIAKKMVPSEAWQRRAIKMHMSVQPEFDNDWSTYIDKVRKDIHDKTQGMFNTIQRFKTKFHLDIGLDINSKDFKKQLENNINKVLNPALHALWIQYGKTKDAKARSAIMDQIREYEAARDAQLAIYRSVDYLQEEGVPVQTEKEQNKSNKAAQTAKEKAQRAAEAAKRKAEAAARKYDNDQIKRFEDRLKALQTARKMYEDWYSKYNDKDFAITQTRLRMMAALRNKEYAPGSIKDSDFTKLTEESALKKLLAISENELRNTKLKTSEGRDRKTSLLAQYAGEGNTLDLNMAEKAIKKFSDEVKRSVDILSKQYEVFKSVYDKTKDLGFAMKLSGYDYGHLPYKRLQIQGYNGWNEQVQGLTEVLFKKLSEMSKSVGGTVNPFTQEELSTLYGLTGDNLKAKVSEYLGDDVVIPEKKKGETEEAYNKRIKPLLNERQKRLNYTDSVVQIVEAWVKALETWTKSSKEAVADFDATNQNFSRKRMAMDKEYNDLAESIYAKDKDGNPLLSDEQKEDFLAKNKLRREYKLLDYDWDLQQLLKSPTSIDGSTARETGKRVMKVYMDAFEKGIIDAATYNTKSKAVIEALSKNTQEGTYGNLLNRMSGIRGIFFNSDNQQNRTDLAAYRENISSRLEDEREKIAIGIGDTDLVAVLERLREAIDAVMGGNGGTDEIRAVGKYGKYVSNWNKTDKNGKPVMTEEQKRSAGKNASLEKYDNLLTGGNSNRGWFKKSEDKMRKPMDDFIKGLTMANAAISLFSNTLDALGLGDTAVGQAASDATDVMGGMLQGASSLSALGPYGMAAGAALGLIGGLAGVHDKHQQKKIDQLQEDVSAIEGYTETIAKAQERTLGYDYGDIIRAYQKEYAAKKESGSEGAAGKAMAKYYQSAGSSIDINGYQQQYNMLIAKRKDYVDMYDTENGKKKKSKSALQDYKEKIADLDDQIKFFGQDLAKNLWDIDLKSWADQLGDALMSAFENGEDAAKAFDDTVRSILQGVFSKMLKLQILEPMFQDLQDKLFGNKDNGTQGVFNPNDIVGSSQKVAQVIAEYFGVNGKGRNAVTAAQQFYNGVNLGLNNAGLTLDNDSGSTLSSGIASASEESVNVLSGYVASMRQDLSMIRLQDSMFYNETLPDYIKTVTAGVSSLQNIDTNVQAIRMLMSENGSLFEQVRTLRDDLHSIVTHQKSVRME